MPLLGCIADDFGGATTFATALAREGMRCVQFVGLPGPAAAVPNADAIVIGLPLRRIPPAEAVAQARAALRWLVGAGCRQFALRYAPTLDGVDPGSIGPVADALVEDLGCGFAVACPAEPRTGVTVFQGHLFVNQVPLGEGGTRQHPAAPMRDSNLVRILSHQTQGTVGLVPFATVDAGVGPIRAALSGLRESGRRYAVVDAASERHLLDLGAAVAGQTLLIGASGIVRAVPQNLRQAGSLPEEHGPAPLPAVAGHAAVLAGSCARTTLLQVGAARGTMPTLELDPLAMPDAAALAASALEWAGPRLGPAPVLVATAAPPNRVAVLRARLGPDAADALVQETIARIALGLVEAGVRNLVVAGHGTAAAAVHALGVERLTIGGDVGEGVPWALAEGTGPTLRLAPKDGHSGRATCFADAFERRPG